MTGLAIFVGILAASIMACHLAPAGPERRAIFVVLMAAIGGLYHLGGSVTAGNWVLITAAAHAGLYTLWLLWRVYGVTR
jgi:hypothetical protein